MAASVRRCARVVALRFAIVFVGPGAPLKEGCAALPPTLLCAGLFGGVEGFQQDASEGLGIESIGSCRGDQLAKLSDFACL